RRMTDARTSLLSKVREKQARVGILGLGYVGLPLAEAFVLAGWPVLGFDTDAAKVVRLSHGESYIHQVSAATIRRMNATGFQATAQLDRLAEPDAILICVPTPLTDAREPDLQFICAAGRAVTSCLRPGQLIVLES